MSRNDKIFLELQKQVKGDVLTSLTERESYSSDSSLYSLTPKAILCPKSSNDILKAIFWCKKHRIPITPRGAGTSTAGQAIGTGLILDFSKYMTRLLKVSLKENTAEIQPGIVYDKLNQQLRPHGLFFPVNPSSGKMATLGGMLANNASGPQSIKYGATKDNVDSLEIILSDGTIFNTSHPPKIFLDSLKDLVLSHQTLIQKYQPKTKVNSSGYNLFELYQNEKINLPKLFIGSEGTLGIITKAKIRLQPLPQFYSCALIGFSSLKEVGSCILSLRNLNPSSLEFLDHDLIQLMKNENKIIRNSFSKQHQIILFLEFDSNDSTHPKEKLKAARKILFPFSHQFLRFSSRNNLWELRKKASPILHRLEGTQKPLKFIEDGAVSPEKLPEYLGGLTDILNRYQVKGTAFGHAGNGHIHINPLLDPRLEEDKIKLKRIMIAQRKLIKSLQGTISGEHGDGILRSQDLKTQYGPLVKIFKKVKDLLDPYQLFNPGKILNEDEQAPFKNWRFNKISSSPRKNHFFPYPTFLEQLDLCHGCGFCRYYCPEFQTRNEEITTGRAKAFLIRSFLAGNLSSNDPEFKRRMTACKSCQICLNTCPTHIDIGQLCKETINYLSKN